MWVVKLGDRLLSAPLLPRWLELLATLGRGRAIIVPGGGCFADAARRAQELWGFDNSAAHDMAVLAMTQSALMMRALQPGLQPVNQDADIRRTLQQGQTALWTPLGLLRGQPDDLTNQEVTSDTLALWLARRLNAERLVLVESCAADATLSSSSHAKAGTLDQRFTAMARDAGCIIDLMVQTDLDRLRTLLTGSSCL